MAPDSALPDSLAGSAAPDLSAPQPHYWLVGAWFEDGGDQTADFVAKGIWRNGYGTGKYADLVARMAPGDRIAIKASSKQERALPFNYEGQPASVLNIKARGTITSATQDGETVQVQWESSAPEMRIYHRSFWNTVHLLDKDKPAHVEVIEMVFHGKVQNLEDDTARMLEKKSARGTSRDLTNQSDDTAHPSDPRELGSPIPAPSPSPTRTPPDPPYSLQSITDDGCFIPPAKLRDLLECLRKEHNMILQGPPGTGKTWLAKRLGYALVGATSQAQVRALQFHPNLSYEDIVCGWRPAGDGRLQKVEGPFLEAVRMAHADLNRPVVLIIEEINRGNPAMIFGEMLTLMESSKRKPGDALRLAYQEPGEPPVWLPPNFYILGTMNIADRSLAIVDFALRRRFSFVDLEPCFNDLWRDHVTRDRGMDRDLAVAIGAAMDELNTTISAHRDLGRQFQIGHSYFTPKRDNPEEDWGRWCDRVLDRKILPLLEEYWFDNPEQARTHIARLRERLAVR